MIVDSGSRKSTRPVDPSVAYGRKGRGFGTPRDYMIGKADRRGQCFRAAASPSTHPAAGSSNRPLLWCSALLLLPPSHSTLSCPSRFHLTLSQPVAQFAHRSGTIARLLLEAPEHQLIQLWWDIKLAVPRGRRRLG